MSAITVQDLQDIAVACTGEFFNNKVPLSVGLAKIASERGLNSDQLRRAVEATNTLTYLKSLQVSDDRTGEFPLADYNEIVKLASMPGEDEAEFQEKTASVSEDTSMVKQAEEALKFEFPQLGHETALFLLQKEAAANRRAIEDKEIYSQDLARRIVKTASDLSCDPQADTLMSAVSGNPDDFYRLAKLVHGQDEYMTHKFQGYGEYLVKNASESKAGQLQALLKEAQEVVDELNYRRGLDKQASEAEDTLIKQAFVETIGKAVGSGIGAVVKGVGGLIGRGAATAAKGVGGAIGKAGQNVVRELPGFKRLNIPKAVQTASTKRNLAVGGALMDAAAYSPSAPKHDGSNMGDVWDALNG